MKTFAIIVSILMAALCLVLSAVVLLQQGKSAGLSGAISGGSSDTYFGRNKNRTLEGKLSTLTKILGASYIVLALVLYFLVAAVTKTAA